MNFCPLDSYNEPLPFIDSIFSQNNQDQIDLNQKNQQIFQSEDQQSSHFQKEKNINCKSKNQILETDLFSDLMNFKQNKNIWQPSMEKQIQFCVNNLQTVETKQNLINQENQKDQKNYNKKDYDLDANVFKKMASKIKKNVITLFQNQKNQNNQPFAVTKNMPRYFLKLIIKYFESEGQKIQINTELKDALKNKTGIKMKKVTQIFLGQNSLRKRATMAKILRKTMKKQVIQKPYITDKLSYLNSIKMFCLRCRSKSLICHLKRK